MNTGLASKRRFVLVLGLLTGIAAVTIDMSLPAFPAMVRDLATSMSTGQLVVGLFVAGIGIGQIPAGLISDRIGRMPVLYSGIGIFTIAGIVCASTDSIEVLLLSRFIQGLGGSVGIVVSRAIIRDISSGVQAARLMSVMVMIFTAAPMLAPIVGGFLVFQWGWRAPFVAVAVFGALTFLGVNTALQETHTPTRREHPMRQLSLSLKEFFSHRRSRFGLLLVILPAAGFIAMITASSAIVIEIYGFPVQAFGFIFAIWGFSILLASMISRYLVLDHGVMRMIGLGAILIGAASLQLLIIAWLGQVSFWWLWGSICLFMFGVGFLMPNATALALDPVPQIAGVAASIIGTMQSISSTAGSLLSSSMYDGTIRNVAIIMGTAGVATSLAFLLRPFILGPEEVVRPDL
jgi:DHA1 family bicyclomycin/chloramphenicol resistance-like MFS transporter